MRNSHLILKLKTAASLSGVNEHIDSPEDSLNHDVDPTCLFPSTAAMFIAELQRQSSAIQPLRF